MYFIPLPHPVTGTPQLYRHQDCCVAADAPLASKSCPVLTYEVPQGLYRELKIVSPPALHAVVQHASRLRPFDAEEDDCLAKGHVLIEFLARNVVNLKASDVATLRASYIVPVSKNHLQIPRLVTKKSADVFCPFMGVLPEEFYPFCEPLLYRLGLVDDVTPAFLDIVQAEALQRYRHQALSVNELAAAVRLLETAADMGVHIRAVPDQRGRLVPAEHCVVNDAPWLTERMTFTQGVFITHSKVTRQTAARANIRVLSAAVKEQLDPAQGAPFTPTEPELSQHLTSRLRSHTFAQCVATILETQGIVHAEHLRDSALHQMLSSLSVQIVTGLCTRLTMIATGEDVTRVPHATAFFDEKGRTVYLTHTPSVHCVVPLSVCVSAILHCPGNLHLEELFRCQEGDLSIVAHSMRIATRTPDEVIAMQRGVPGYPVSAEDESHLVPALKISLLTGETVAWEDPSKVRRYGRVVHVSFPGLQDPLQIPTYSVLVGLCERKTLPGAVLWRFEDGNPNGPSNGNIDSSTTPAQQQQPLGGLVMTAPEGETATRESLVETVCALLERINVPISMEGRDMLQQITSLNRELNVSREHISKLTTNMAQQTMRIQNLEISLQCPICYGKIAVALAPCGHCLCEECVKRMNEVDGGLNRTKKCYSCRRNVESFVKLFL